MAITLGSMPQQSIGDHLNEVVSARRTLERFSCSEKASRSNGPNQAISQCMMGASYVKSSSCVVLLTGPTS